MTLARRFTRLTIDCHRHTVHTVSMHDALLSMDRTGPVTLPGVLVGAVFAFPAGMLYATFRRAWRDVSTYQKSTQNATNNAWKRTADLIVLGLLLAICAAYALGSDALSQQNSG